MEPSAGLDDMEEYKGKVKSKAVKGATNWLRSPNRQPSGPLSGHLSTNLEKGSLCVRPRSEGPGSEAVAPHERREDARRIPQSSLEAWGLCRRQG
jgi:hypothetical protein